MIQAGSADVTYYVSLTRSLLVSHNADLVTFRWVRLDGTAPTVPPEDPLVAQWAPIDAFSSQTFGYAVRLTEGVSSVRFEADGDGQARLGYRTTRSLIAPSSSDPKPTPSDIIDLGSSSGAQSAIISVPSGERQRVDVFVVAEDGVTGRNYSFNLGSFAQTELPPVPTDRIGQYQVGNNTGNGEDNDGDDGSTGLDDGSGAASVPGLTLAVAALLGVVAAAGAKIGL